MQIFLYILFFPFFIIYWLIQWTLISVRISKIKKIPGKSFRIYIAGTQYKNDDGTDRQSFIKKCRPGEELILVKTPSKYDEYGIQVYRQNGECLGWIPARYSYEFSTEMERGREIRAFFFRKIKPNREFDFYGGRITIIKN